MIGKTILHYKILEKLGEGGMGIVYLAEDTKLKRQVAIKFLPAQLASNSQERKRFEIEAQAAAALNHPNIATIYAIEEFDGDNFIVMEYIDGIELKDKITSEKVLLRDVLNISMQIAEGLQAAHERNVIHRDIKSTNIMLTTKGKVKIMDFGLAKVGQGIHLTKEKSTLGTAPYMSPEQIRGDEIDHKSDIWSFGVIMYEMLTGLLPFKGEYEQAVAYSIVNENPKPVNDNRDDIPVKLVQLVNRALVKDPDGRYRNMEEMISELEKLKREQSREQSTDTKTVKNKSRNLITLPIVILSLFVLFFIWYWFLFRETTGDNNPEVMTWDNSLAVLPFTNASGQTDQDYFCDGMTKQVLSSLSKLHKMKVISHKTVRKYQDSEKTIPEIGQELEVENILLGSVSKFSDRIRIQVQLINVRDDAHIWAENYDYVYDIEKLFAVYDDISEKITESLLQNITAGTNLKADGLKPVNTYSYELYLKGQLYHSDKFMNRLRQK